MKNKRIMTFVLSVIVIAAAAVIGAFSVNGLTEKSVQLNDSKESEIAGLNGEEFTAAKKGGEGQSGGSWNKRISMIKYWTDVDGALMRDFDEQINVDINDLTVYDYKTFLLHCPYYISKASSSSINDLCQMNAVYPIEYMIKINENRICVVYKFKYKEMDPTYCFIVFEKQNLTIEGALHEEWIRTNDVYYINHLYSYDDFAKITPGCSAKMILDMDKGELYKNLLLAKVVYTDSGYSLLYDENCTERQYYKMIFYKPLPDGVLGFICEKEATPDGNPNDINGYTVSEIKLYEYGDEIFTIKYNTNVYEIFSCLNNVK